MSRPDNGSDITHGTWLFPASGARQAAPHAHWLPTASHDTPQNTRCITPNPTRLSLIHATMTRTTVREPRFISSWIIIGRQIRPIPSPAAAPNVADSLRSMTASLPLPLKSSFPARLHGHPTASPWPLGYPLLNLKVGCPRLHGSVCVWLTQLWRWH